MREMSESYLDELIVEWHKEYGPGGLPGGGANILQTLIDHKGEPPAGGGSWGRSALSVADDVEAAVTRMQLTPSAAAPNQFYRAAMVFRAEHLGPAHWPEEERLRQLARVGLPMSRHTYYRSIQFARAYLMGALARKEVA